MSKRETPPAVGGSSLLVIFAVLCLTIFALLSLSTVQAERRLSEASYEAVKGYYEADTAAELMLANLRKGSLPNDVTKEDNLYKYTCRVSDTQALEVEVEITEESYRVLRWQLVSTTEWEADESLDVWNGSME